MQKEFFARNLTVVFFGNYNFWTSETFKYIYRKQFENTWFFQNLLESRAFLLFLESSVCIVFSEKKPLEIVWDLFGQTNSTSWKLSKYAPGSYKTQKSLHKKWSFQLRICSVNLTKPAENCGFGHIYWRNP